MPWHDPNDPADTDDVGDGDDELKAIRLKLNTDMENVVVYWDGSDLHPVEGFMRTYDDANASPTTPPAGYQTGRLWTVSDHWVLRGHDGMAWRNLQHRDLWVLIPSGVASVFDTSGAWISKNVSYWDATLQQFTSLAMTANDGLPFDEAYCAYGTEILFWSMGAVGTGSQLDVRLYDDSSGGADDITGSDLAFTAATADYKESGDLTGAFRTGLGKLRIQVKTTGGTGIHIQGGLRLKRVA